MTPTGRLLFQCWEVGSRHLDFPAGKFWGDIKCVSLPWALETWSAPWGWVSAGFRMVFFFFGERKSLYFVLFF